MYFLLCIDVIRKKKVFIESFEFKIAYYDGYFSNIALIEYNLLLLYRIDNIKHIAMMKKANSYAIRNAFYYAMYWLF